MREVNRINLDNAADEVNRLHEEMTGIYQSAVESGMPRAIRIGEVLTEKKASMKHGDWIPWIEANLVFGKREAQNYMRVYKKRNEVNTQPVAHLKQAVAILSDKESIGGAHVSNNSGEQEWYTPKVYIDAARKVMGSIDLDPASNAKANEIVSADTFYTIEDNGLSKPWFGNVWMNPPYAQPIIKEFCNMVSEKWIKGDVNQACVLTNNATETDSIQSMFSNASSICFPKGRIKYLDSSLKPANTPLQGQCIVYFGFNSELFQEVFNEFGVTILCQRT